MIERLPVLLHARDPISYAGIKGQLAPRPEVRIVSNDEWQTAKVALVVTDRIDEAAIRALRGLRARAINRLVIVATQIDESELVAVVEIGVAGLVRRADATAEHLVTVLKSAAAGDGAVPPDLLGRLLNQVGQLQRQVLGPRGLTFSGLAEREVQVLRLVADGFDTEEIAQKLSYSQRTVKNVLHDVTSRLHLRNRSHAVAYALKHGLI
jgi:DNA-binding NarL/FixJ family response regulator